MLVTDDDELPAVLLREEPACLDAELPGIGEK
jgi:hypothetical protein